MIAFFFELSPLRVYSYSLSYIIYYRASESSYFPIFAYFLT